MCCTVIVLGEKKGLTSTALRHNGQPITKELFCCLTSYRGQRHLSDMSLQERQIQVWRKASVLSHRSAESVIIVCCKYWLSFFHHQNRLKAYISHTPHSENILTVFNFHPSATRTCKKIYFISTLLTYTIIQLCYFYLKNCIVFKYSITV
jgi:hypothetical protein